MNTKAKRVRAIRDGEIGEAWKRVEAACRPLVQAEFDRLRRRYPDLEKILFGNGTHVLVFRKGSRFGGWPMSGTLPKAFDDLEEMCVELRGCMDDVRPSEQT